MHYFLPAGGGLCLLVLMFSLQALKEAQTTRLYGACLEKALVVPCIHHEREGYHFDKEQVQKKNSSHLPVAWTQKELLLQGTSCKKKRIQRLQHCHLGSSLHQEKKEERR